MRPSVQVNTEVVRGQKTFTFKGRELLYLDHPYNSTRFNERKIECPVIWDIVQQESGRVLEVGNVLAHYYKTNHLVVDRDEINPGVINESIETYNDEEGFDLIVSISTMEHVGWHETDESERDSRLTWAGFETIKRLIRPNGKAVVTIPLGYNPHIDSWIRRGKLGAVEEYYFTRDGFTEWKEISKEECWSLDHSHKSLMVRQGIATGEEVAWSRFGASFVVFLVFDNRLNSTST